MTPRDTQNPGNFRIPPCFLMQAAVALHNNLRAIARGDDPKDLVQASFVDQMLSKYLPPPPAAPSYDPYATHRMLEEALLRGVTPLFGPDDHYFTNA